jgi:hypothetical protein
MPSLSDSTYLTALNMLYSSPCLYVISSVRKPVIGPLRAFFDFFSHQKVTDDRVCHSTREWIVKNVLYREVNSSSYNFLSRIVMHPCKKNIGQRGGQGMYFMVSEN